MGFGAQENAPVSRVSVLWVYFPVGAGAGILNSGRKDRISNTDRRGNYFARYIRGELEKSGVSVCPCCSSNLEPGVRSWHLVCRICTYEGSNLEPRILEQKADGDLDESAREDALRDLRVGNFDRLAKRIGGLLNARRENRMRLLDVGCAHGWFLERMSRDFEVAGIEPDPLIAQVARARL